MNDSTGPQSASQRDLPVVGQSRPERADARRNRLRVLEAADRVTAFLDAYLDLLDRHVELFMDSENASDGARYRIGSYHLWRRHLALLIEEARPDLDADYTAHLLLAPLAADLHHALRTTGFDLGRLKTGLRHATETLLRPARS